MVSKISSANKHIGFDFYTEKALGQWLLDPGITEICINRPNELFYEKNQEWFYEKIDFSYFQCVHLAKAIAAFKKDKIESTKPILSATLLNGERVQVIMPPACEKDTIAITVRKPSNIRFRLQEYEENSFFSATQRAGEAADEDADLLKLYQEGAWSAFLEQAVLKKKNIVVAGATGTGKTTFMKTMVDLIPTHERLITIEDTHELTLEGHPNHVHLLYNSEAKEGDIVTASSLLKCCMRMKPDRILLAEIRGGEAFDFLKAMSSGHGGSITSIHAGSVEEAFEQLTKYALAHPQGIALPFEALKFSLRSTIDIVLQIVIRDKKRVLKEVYFKSYAHRSA